LSYLAFLLATAVYWMQGTGAPLQRDFGRSALGERVAAIEPPLWLRFILMVVVPVASLALLVALLTGILGGIIELIVGVAVLLFSFGRLDFPTVTERYLARARHGDAAGAALVLEECGLDGAAHDNDGFAADAARIFLYEGFQRWFAPVFYFLLLGPYGALAYRLTILDNSGRRGDLLVTAADWLPARMLVLTFAAVGSFAGAWNVLKERAFEPEVATEDLLLESAESALALDSHDTNAASRVAAVLVAIKKAWVVWILVVSVLAIL